MISAGFLGQLCKQFLKDTMISGMVENMAGKTMEKELDFIFLQDGFIPDIAGKDEVIKENKTAASFFNDRYMALYNTGLMGKPGGHSASAGFLYIIADTFFKKLTEIPELEIVRENAQIEMSEDDYMQLLQAVPFAAGAEYINREWIGLIFSKLLAVFAKEISVYNGTVQMYLTEKSQHLHVPERIFFHLVENRDGYYPFAFMATYATKRDDGGIQHVPLEYALSEYRDNRDRLLSLLSCLEKAADVSGLISGFMHSGELFHPLRLTVQEAYSFLKDVEAIENTGILCRIPNWWKKKYSTVSLSIKLGDKKPSAFGLDAILSVKPEMVVDGVRLTKKDVQELMKQTEGLAFIKGKWIEADHKHLEKLLKEIDNIPENLTLMDALKMQLGSGGKDNGIEEKITNGKWLADTMERMRKPGKISRTPAIPPTLNAVLRPYQKDGYAWLDYMYKLGFGACLADDMGLGKTVQVLAFLEKMRMGNKDARVLLVVPASLVENWRKEAQKFVPSLDIFILHGRPSKVLEEELKDNIAFLTVTTYGMVTRIKGLQDINWECIILDEAQAVKNALTKQTKEIKKLKGNMKIAMTGTPIENDLSNLWSLFDFLNKGFLGTSKEFGKFVKELGEHQEKYGRLRSMITPFMLRRLKTDKKIIADLPEKMETIDYAELGKKQVVLYNRVILELERSISDAEGIQRKGLVLAAITKLKQICNHPDQYLGQDGYGPSESGKFALLKEICETIYEKRERVLVFTQYKEITRILENFLEKIFHRKGCVIHGGISPAKRGKIVEKFQSEEYVPFLILSTRAGGTGLNLTKANHVIHFDRWWNPAVENQATDRAFRIGQTKNVLVHKLVCKGTIEEKIDEMITSKKELAENIIGKSGESWITELDNDTLMKMFKLTI